MRWKLVCLYTTLGVGVCTLALKSSQSSRYKCSLALHESKNTRLHSLLSNAHFIEVEHKNYAYAITRGQSQATTHLVQRLADPAILLHTTVR